MPENERMYVFLFVFNALLHNSSDRHETWEVFEYSPVKVSVTVHLPYDRWRAFTQTSLLQLNVNNDTAVLGCYKSLTITFHFA